MPTINEYSPDIYLPDYIKTNYNNDLENQLLIKKQQEYNTVLSKLNNLRSQALNISMINNAGKQRLDEYNKEIADTLSGDLGDLTDPKIQSKLANLFTKIASDDDLKYRSKLSQYYQGEQQTIQRMKTAKDPTKSGYNPINEFVFNNYEGGLYDFVNADDVKGWDKKRISYTPYKDLSVKWTNLTKQLKDETNAQISYDGAGHILTNITSGVSKERISQYLQMNLDADDIAQLDILAKYRVLTTPKDELYVSFNNWTTNEMQDIDRQLKQVSAYKTMYDPSNIPSTVSAEEKKILLVEWAAKRDMYDKQEKALLESKSQLRQIAKTPEEWAKFSNSDMLPFVKQMQLEQRINGISDALEHMDRIEKVQMDQAAFEREKLQLMANRDEWNRYMDQESLKLEYLKSNKSSSSDGSDKSVWSDRADQTADPTQAAALYESMNVQVDTLLKKTSDPTADPNFDIKKFDDPSYRKENESNYYLQYWDKYKQLNPGKTPNLQEFKAFVEQVDQGYFYSDPNVQSIRDNLNRDRQVQQYYQGKIMQVNDILDKEGTNMLDVSNGNHTLREYIAKDSNGKEIYKNGEPVFAFSDGKGGSKYMTKTELQNQYKKWDESHVSNWFIDFPTTFEGFTREILVNGSSVPKEFESDPYFFHLMVKGFNQERSNQQLLDKEGTDPLSVSNGEHTLREYIAKDNGKEVYKNGEPVFAFSNGKGGFTYKTKSELKKEYQVWKENNVLGRDPSTLPSWVNAIYSTSLGNFIAPYVPKVLDYFDEQIKPPEMFSGDKHFFALMAKGFEQEESNSKLLEKVFNEQLPAWAQYGQVSTENKEEIQLHQLPLINQSYKLSDGSAFNFTSQDIVQVNRGVGGSQQGTFTLSKEGAERLTSLGVSLYDPSGKEIDTFQPMQEFKFMAPGEGYDFAHNQILKESGTLNDFYRGYKTTYSINKSNPSDMVVTIYDQRGNQVSQTTKIVYNKDINVIMKEVRLGVDQYIQSTKK